jgi:hypothetical protein
VNISPVIKPIKKDKAFPTLEELLEQNLELHQEIEEIETRYRTSWALLVDVSRRLQISSASVKAAVSSLLNQDIFWDVSVQHEFLETINHSADDLSYLAMLVSLASRLRVDKIELKREPHILQEILSVFENDICKRIESLELDITFQRGGDTVFVDYEYLMIALRLLFDSFSNNRNGPVKIQLIAIETAENWLLEIRNIPSPIYTLVCNMSVDFSDGFLKTEQVSPEKAMMVFIATQIFRLQEIQLIACRDDKSNDVLQLSVPLYLKQF